MLIDLLPNSIHVIARHRDNHKKRTRKSRFRLSEGNNRHKVM